LNPAAPASDGAGCQLGVGELQAVVQGVEDQAELGGKIAEFRFSSAIAAAGSEGV
jgi:hypothetical protein